MLAFIRNSLCLSLPLLGIAPFTQSIDQQDTAESYLKKALSAFDTVHYFERLPVNDLVMVVNAKGEKMLIDTHSRIAIRGKFEVMDVWNRAIIHDWDSLRGSWNLTLGDLSLSLEDLASFSLGNSLKRAPDLVVLIDPTMTSLNERLLRQVQAHSDKHIAIVLTPLMTDSEATAQSWWCRRDRETVRLALSQVSPVPDADPLPSCSTDPMLKARVLANLLNVKGLPFLIRADGLHNQGVPEDLGEFFKLPLIPSFKNTQKTKQAASASS